jgi:hypothetical protein
MKVLTGTEITPAADADAGQVAWCGSLDYPAAGVSGLRMGRRSSADVTAS